MRKLGMDELNRKSVAEFKGSEKIPVIIVMDNIRSMHNVGSVFRTADAFLVQGIYLCGYTPQPPHRDIHKTALGATETVDWKYFATTAEAVQSLRKAGYTVLAVEQVENSLPLHRVVQTAEFRTFDYSCLALVDGGPNRIPLWAIDADQVEGLEVYPRSARPSRSMSRQQERSMLLNGDCPTVFVWTRR